jgi:hypothetical protein
MPFLKGKSRPVLPEKRPRWPSSHRPGQAWPTRQFKKRPRRRRGLVGERLAKGSPGLGGELPLLDFLEPRLAALGLQLPKNC